jgi:hypothetical protein
MTSRLFVALTLLGTIAPATCYADDSGCGPTSIPVVKRGEPGAPTVELYGRFAALHGTNLTLTNRDGKPIRIDVAAVATSPWIRPDNVGNPIEVLSTVGPHGVLLAQAIARAKSSPMGWPPDCYAAKPR